MQPLEISVSTGSEYPGAKLRDGYKFVHNGLVTPHVIEQTIATKQTIESSIPLDIAPYVSFGVSLKIAHSLNNYQLTHSLKDHAIPVTSIDLPDIEPRSALPGKMTEAIISSIRDNSPKAIFGRAANHVGWYELNVRTQQEGQRLLHKAMYAVKEGQTSSSPYIVIRTSVDKFMSREMETTLHDLSSYSPFPEFKKIAFALEISSIKYTPAEYMNIIRQLHERKQYGIPVFADLDLGHIAETTKHHDVVPDVNDFLADVLSGPDSQYVGTISWNQYSGERETHVWLDDPNGMVKVDKMAQTIYKYGDKLPLGQMVVIETNPIYAPQLSGNEMTRVLNKFFDAYLSR